MFKPRYQIKRLRNMAKEWWRLTKLYTTKDKRSGMNHFQFDWQMNSYKGNPFARSYIPLNIHDDPKHPNWGRPWYDDNGEQVTMKRDLYDQIIDTITDIVSLFWRNIFIEQTCTHPHESVHIEWDGDHDDGYWRQTRCYRCHGYVGDDQIDRYLPSEDRHPELIKGSPINPMDRPRHRPVRDDENDFGFFESDYIL